ncbi:MAG: RNA polymerase sigma-I factor [Clostridia bacterium]|nr:MAG: RNA polymerase sigma-I factor [Clostridia bacterium]
MGPPPGAEELVARARLGDALAREQVLAEHRPWVQKVASATCRRFLEWGRDEELSVALLAFNEAIDRYDASRGVPFLAYARQVVRSRLVDFLRRETRERERFILGLEAAGTWPEAELAREKYDREMAAAERAAEISAYAAVLQEFGLSLAELARVSPKHRDSRQLMLRAARTLAEHQELFQHLVAKKKLPLVELSLASGIPRKTLEKGRKYIVAVSLILGQPEEFTYLYSYLRG